MSHYSESIMKKQIGCDTYTNSKHEDYENTINNFATSFTKGRTTDQINTFIRCEGDNPIDGSLFMDMQYSVEDFNKLSELKKFKYIQYIDLDANFTTDISRTDLEMNSIDGLVQLHKNLKRITFFNCKSNEPIKVHKDTNVRTKNCELKFERYDDEPDS